MEEDCSTVDCIKFIGTKPRLLVVRRLRDGELGFNQLKKKCGLSSRTLALNLKFLSKNRLVRRRKQSNRVFYSLTPMGADLVKIVDKFGEWKDKWNVAC